MFSKFKSLVAFINLFLIFSVASAQWKKINSPSNTDLYGVSVLGNTVYAVGNSSIVLKSLDTGKSWSQITISPLNNLRTLYFIDSLTGFVTGENARMMKTTDGGKNWTQKYVKTAAFAYDMTFYNNHAVAVGKDMLAISSTDYGDNWTVDTTEVKFRDLNSVTIMPDGNCWAVGDLGYLLNKHVSEKKWKIGNCPTNIKLNYISHIGNNVLIVAGGMIDTTAMGKYFNVLLISTDTGKNWQQTKLGEMKIINSGFFTTRDSGFLIGNNGLISKCDNGLNNRGLQLGGTASALNKITFSGNIGLIVGDGGTILRTTNMGGKVLAIHDMPAQAENLKVFPNPCSGSFYLQGNPVFYNVRIFDSQGKIIYKNALFHTSESIQLPSTGIYYLYAENANGDLSKTLINAVF